MVDRRHRPDADARNPESRKRRDDRSTRTTGNARWSAYLTGDHDIAGAQASSNRAAEPGDRDRIRRDASGDQSRGPGPGGAHARAQHQRFGKAATHGHALDAKGSDDKEARLVGVHVSQSYLTLPTNRE